MKNLALLTAALFGALSAGFAIMSALFGYPPFRDQHLGGALIYLHQVVDLLRVQIVGFNANGVPTILEFPWWQAGAAWAMRLTDGWWGGANLFSLAVFTLAVPPMYKMGVRLLGRNHAWWVVALFLAQPVVFDAAGMASCDGMSLVAALWSYDRIRAFAKKGGLMRGLSAFSLAAVSATLKLPFFMTAGLAAALEVLGGNWRFWQIWGRLAGAAIFAALMFWGWTRYADACLSQALWPLVDLRVSHNPGMAYWYFGDWAYRLSPGIWAMAGWKAANSLFGSFALVGFAVGGWVLSANREGRCWLTGALLTTALFTHLVFQHRHYYLMFAPGVALAMAAGASWMIVRCFGQDQNLQRLAAAGFFLLLVPALVQGMMGREVVIQFDPYPRAIAQQVAEKTSEKDRLLIAGGGWGGETLFRAQRKGLSIWNTGFLEDPEHLKKTRELGFNKLVLIRESPLLVALQKTNPGNAGYAAEPFAHFLSPVADGFPVLYQDEQLMIREISPR